MVPKEVASGRWRNGRRPSLNRCSRLCSERTHKHIGEHFGLEPRTRNPIRVPLESNEPAAQRGDGTTQEIGCLLSRAAQIGAIRHAVKKIVRLLFTAMIT